MFFLDFLWHRTLSLNQMLLTEDQSLKNQMKDEAHQQYQYILE